MIFVAFWLFPNLITFKGIFKTKREEKKSLTVLKYTCRTIHVECNDKLWKDILSNKIPQDLLFLNFYPFHIKWSTNFNI